MTVSIHLTDLSFASGQNISLKSDSIVVLVGPNSSGKSQSLKDIIAHTQTYTYNRKNSYKGVAVTDITIETVGSRAQYIDFLHNNSIVVNNARMLAGTQFSPPEGADQHWEIKHLHLIWSIFAKLIGTQDRLTALSQKQRINRSNAAPQFPLQVLDLDASKELSVSSSFAAIFGTGLSLDRGSGSVVNLHVGPSPDPKRLGGQFSSEYSDQVRLLADIDGEGDGVKAVAGLFLDMIGLPKSVYLIDEPDVYLHPPQAAAAAKELVKISAEKQLFVATHNVHFLRGLIEADRKRLIIVRLDRMQKQQTVHLVDQQIFEDVKSDPLIKFTSLLEAVFFRTVVVCENEADCLFYRSVVRGIDKTGKDENIFWISAHGKQNIKKLVKVLRAIGVNAVSTPDLDIINDQTNLRGLIESHGGEWSDFKPDFDIVSRLMGTRKPTFATDDVRTEVMKVLDDTEAGPDGLFPTSSAVKIKDVLRSASPWRELKESGISVLGRGDNFKAAKALLDKMRDIGIVIPEVGEMESFHPTTSAHGVDWVNAVLKLDLVNDPELSDARKFAEQLNRILVY